jgi:hypothetical protein
MGRLEAKALVEPVCIDSVSIRGQLDQAAVTESRLADSPPDHGFADSASATVGPDSDGFDLRSLAPAQDEVWNEGQLQGADDVTALFDDHEAVSWVSVDLRERIQVRLGQRISGALSGLSKWIVGVHPNDQREIVGRRISERDVSHRGDRSCVPAHRLPARRRLGDP